MEILWVRPFSCVCLCCSDWWQLMVVSGHGGPSLWRAEASAQEPRSASSIQGCYKEQSCTLSSSFRLIRLRDNPLLPSIGSGTKLETCDVKNRSYWCDLSFINLCDCQRVWPQNRKLVPTEIKAGVSSSTIATAQKIMSSPMMILENLPGPILIFRVFLYTIMSYLLPGENIQVIILVKIYWNNDIGRDQFLKKFGKISKIITKFMWI